MSTHSVVHAPAPLRQHPRFVFHHSYSTVIEFKGGNKKKCNLIFRLSKTDAYKIIDREKTNFALWCVEGELQSDHLVF